MAGGVIGFDIPGPPVAKGRPRISTRGGFARAYTPQKTVNFEARVALAAQQAMGGQDPMQGALSLRLTVQLPIPQSWSRKKQIMALSGMVRPCSRPDIDNYVKAICDGGNGIVWRDDSQITHLRAIKLYSDIPGVAVEVRELA